MMQIVNTHKERDVQEEPKWVKELKANVDKLNDDIVLLRAEVNKIVNHLKYQHKSYD
jgi:hypothetical protein